MAMIRVHLHINGIVHGVGYRYYAKQLADELKLTGWIKNCSDGSVESMIEGSEPAIESFVQWAHHGPSAAQVSFVTYESLVANDEFDHFAIH